MDFVRFADIAQSTLSSSINSSITSLDVDDPSSFPSNPFFYILIDTEIMYVTGVSGTTFTIVRGSSPVSHTSTTVVYGVLTAKALNSRLSSIIQFGPSSNIITSDPDGAGRLYVVSNVLSNAPDWPFMAYDKGTSIQRFERWGLYSPIISYNTWDQNSTVNYYSGTYSSSGGHGPFYPAYPAYLYLFNNNSSVGNYIGSRYVINSSAHSTKNILISRLEPFLTMNNGTTAPTTDYYEWGLALIDDSIDKAVTLAVRNDNGVTTLRLDKWSSFYGGGTFNSNYFSFPIVYPQYKYLALQNDLTGGKINCGYGPDPYNINWVFNISNTNYSSTLSSNTNTGIFVNSRIPQGILIAYDYYSVLF